MNQLTHVHTGGRDRFRHVVFQPRLKAEAPRLWSPLHPLLGGEAEPLHAFAGTAGAFLREVLQRAGLRPEDYRMPPLQRRLPACLRRLKARTVEAAWRRLEEQPDAWEAAIDALMIGVTSLYRDVAVFDILRQRILPEMRAVQRDLRVWSAACSDGAELMTIAALLSEAGMLAGSRLRGTDCRPHAIATARRRQFGPAALASFPVDLRDHCFRQTGRWFIPIGPLAEAKFDWRVDNVLADDDDEPEESHDLILCRNVAIYLNDRAARALWRRLGRCLRPGGILVVGKAERPVDESLQAVAPCIYRRRQIQSGEANQG